MQYCPNCGTPCEEDALFCEACGTDLRDDAVLQEEPKESEQQPVRQRAEREEPSRRNMTALIAGAVVLVAVIIAGTAFGVHMIKSKGEKQEQQAMASNLPDQEEDGQAADAENEKEDAAPGSEEKETDTELKPTIAPLEEEPDMDGKSTDTPAEAGTDAESDPAASDAGEKANTELKPTIAPLEEEPVSEVQSAYETYYVVNCKESITLRKSASTKAGEYCQIPLGAAVSFVEKAENGFYKVIYNGTTGYALASYLSPEEGSDSGEGSRMVVVNCKESITLRKIPSTKGEEFCQIPLGAEVEYLGTAENGFYTVKYNGFTGYALASYLAWAS